MRMFLYAIFDSASGIYDRPFCAQTDGAAVRMFSDLAVDADHVVGRHPEDFKLFRIGDFNDNSGEIQPEAPVCVGKAHELAANAQKVVPGSLDLFDKRLDADGYPTNGGMRDAT